MTMNCRQAKDFQINNSQITITTNIKKNRMNREDQTEI